ncbi:hypothetical protein [Blastococcus xanthinilyticus]|uniref:Uncharacterized protein n=1 Tax=Blastococcus xanthinilyticus TaxID=1564164 RepID=A0A5S5CKX9_9ACTN|nr:hypothetical protein [Blastococcus xanthinilyticus]TYP80683.1 hypothetical protein BD833_1286 [Blastococcus xanthinilyticus]
MSQPPLPDWAASTPAWEPAVPQPPVPAVPPAPAGARWGVAGAALAGAAVGAVAAGALVAAVFVGSAEDIGRSMAQELAPGISEGIAEGIAEGTREQMESAMGLLEEEALGWYGGMPAGDVEQFPAVPPADLGPDATLDAYALSCFDGDLQACDDLLYESPPLSDYETYATTCGGRVKPYAVPLCTELE